MTTPGQLNRRPHGRLLVTLSVALVAILTIGFSANFDTRWACAKEASGAKKCSPCRVSRKKTGPLRRLLVSRSRNNQKCCPKQTADDPYAWKSLFDGKTLDGWKVPNFGGQGEVLVENGTIVMETGSYMTGITWKGEPPRENFELELEGMRLQGSDFFCTTTFPVGEKNCSFVVGGWGGTVTGLSCVDFYDAVDNDTTDFLDFKDKKWYKVRIRVSKDYVRVWIGDKLMVDQEREGHKFGIRDEVDLCQPLGISTWETTGAVRNIRIRRINPAIENPNDTPIEDE
jgi:hypothetical protein